MTNHLPPLKKATNKALVRRAAKLLEEHAAIKWESCVDNKGNGFSCTDINCSALCRREWEALVSTAKDLRKMVRK